MGSRRSNFISRLGQELNGPPEKCETSKRNAKKLRMRNGKMGNPMKIKYGRYGKFLACSNFPDMLEYKTLRRLRRRDKRRDGAEASAEPETQEVCENAANR